MNVPPIFMDVPPPALPQMFVPDHRDDLDKYREARL